MMTVRELKGLKDLHGICSHCGEDVEDFICSKCGEVKKMKCNTCGKIYVAPLEAYRKPLCILCFDKDEIARFNKKVVAKEKVIIEYKKKAEDLAKELGIRLNRDKNCYIYQTVYEMLKQVEEEFIRNK